MAVISVDQALWYHVEDIGIDYPRIAAFYEQLDYPGKTSFEDCRIHISGLGYLDRAGGPLARQQLARNPRSEPESRFWKKHVLVDGVHLLERGDAHLLDPLAPPADVLLFLGSSAYQDDYSRLAPALGQQLAAHARGKAAYPAMPDGEEELRAELAEQEAAALRKLRRDGTIEIAAGGVASGAVAAVAGSLSLLAGPAGDFVRGVVTETVFGAVETASESESEQRKRWKTGGKVLDHVLAREAAPGYPAAVQTLDQGVIRCQPRTGDHLRAPIVIWSRPRRGINQANHRRRSLRRVPLTRAGED